MMQILETNASLRHQVELWRLAGQSVAFVPTMGNLHDGHIALIRHARKQAERIVASIFVNPLQFNDPADLQRYPVTLDSDRRQLTSAQVDALFLPAVGEIYPYGLDTSVCVTVPCLADCLEGVFRPGHFAGVATVMTKLFNIVQPDLAVLGEKDLQQLLVIRRLVADLCLPVDVQSVATVREPDGLALSSRNSFLSAEERQRAGSLYRELLRVREHWRRERGAVCLGELEQSAKAALEDQGFRPEYVSIRRGDDMSVPAIDQPHDNAALYVLVAAWLGKTRLIDNLPL